MNKKEFLSGLEMALKRKCVPDIPEILADYNEHFEAGASNGKSEQQIIIELGSVEAIVAEYGEGAGGAGYMQNFGNITNFYNASGGAAVGVASVAGSARTTGTKEVSKTEKDNAPLVSGHGEDKAAEKDNKGKSTLSVILGIVFGFAYVVGAIAIIAVSVGLGIAAVSAAISLIFSGAVLAVSTWFVFGAFLVKLSGLFAGLALIMLGVLISKVLFAAITLIKTIYNFVTGLFKKAIQGV